MAFWKRTWTQTSTCPLKVDLDLRIVWLHLHLDLAVAGLVTSLRPLGNQSLPEHVRCKNGGDTPKNVFSRAAQEITKENKKHLNMIFHPLARGPCGPDFHGFWHVDIITLVKFQIDRSRGFGATGAQHRGFPLTLIVALTTVLRTNVLHYDLEDKIPGM